MVSSGDLALCFDARILGEYTEVLARAKFGFRPTDCRLLLEHVKAVGHVVAPVPMKIGLPDPDHEVFVEVASAGGAECLVTGQLETFPVEELPSGSHHHAGGLRGETSAPMKHMRAAGA
jgi:predicted nucleic acid-binding protein